jgi:hypothetical protein
MNRRDIVIGVIILLLLGGVIYWRQSQTPSEETVVPDTLSETQQKLEDKFNITIPEGVDKAELKDQTGGTASGIATRDKTDSTTTVDVIADLPEPESGNAYLGWLMNSDGESIKLGTLNVAKGGWTLDYKTQDDIGGYNQVIVSQQASTGETPEGDVLEGSF